MLGIANKFKLPSLSASECFAVFSTCSSHVKIKISANPFMFFKKNMLPTKSNQI